MTTKQAQELKEILKNNFPNDESALKFLKRIKEGKITRDENPKSHICVYFAAYDPVAKQVFIGHHKKSGFWLFNGGHIDKGETMKESLSREIGEEWGLNANNLKIKMLAFLTITEIDNPTKQPCNWHYDLWNFIAMDKNTFHPVEEKLLEEFHEAGWRKNILLLDLTKKYFLGKN